MSKRTPGRTCGKCTACCTNLAVAALDKPDFCRCENLGRFGCKIYSRRPAECQQYECLWLHGELQDRGLRPDRLGVVFTPAESQVFGEYVQLTEVRPGAAAHKRVKKIVEILGRALVVLHITKDRRVVLAGPPDKIGKISEKMGELRAGPQQDLP